MFGRKREGEWLTSCFLFKKVKRKKEVMYRELLVQLTLARKTFEIEKKEKRGERKFFRLGFFLTFQAFSNAKKLSIRENLVDPASNICLDEGLSHANVRISRFRQICGRLSKKGKKKEGEKFVDNERKSFNNTKSVAKYI
jgi:hypothetical protein